MDWPGWGGTGDGPSARGEPGLSRATARGDAVSVATREVRAVDLAVLVSVPAMLLAVYGLPAAVRRQLALSYVEPTPLTAIASHFVHLAPGHLGANLGVYAVVATVSYLLCAYAGRRHEFFVAFLVFLLAFPGVLSALNVALARPRLGYGFSGINTAFFGLVPIALTWYLQAGLGVPVEPRDAPTFFFASTTVVALVAVPPSFPSLAIAVVGVLATTLYLLTIAERARAVRRRLLTVWGTRPGYVEFGVVGLATLAVFPLAAFPADPASGGQVVNLYAHLLGYTLGFMAAYVTFGLIELDPTPQGPATGGP